MKNDIRGLVDSLKTAYEESKDIDDESSRQLGVWIKNEIEVSILKATEGVVRHEE